MSTTPSAWRPIATAPKEGALLLWLPELDSWAPGPWRGAWSWTKNQWAVHMPFTVDGKAAVATELPQPTHWMELPALPEKDPT